MFRLPALTRRLSSSHPIVFIAIVGMVAFTAYCCVYAFRKPFTAGAYSGLSLWGIQFKIALVMAQVFGYALSKFVGIRVIGELTPARRVPMILAVTSVAVLSLLGFAVTPYPYNIFWMFINGLPLGIAWGLVFSYLEGRRVTEALAAILCVNFIISSGYVKTVGKWLLDGYGVSEWWMPFTVALLFLPGLLFSLWVLEHIPPPSEADRALRSERVAMSAPMRRRFLQRYGPGLFFLVLVYLLLTIVRDMRDNFAVEIWAELGFGGQPAILTTAELPIAVFSLLCVAATTLIKDNFWAFWINLALSIGGAGLMAGSTFLFQQGHLSPVWWMMLSGFGVFLPYILYNGVLFDRFIAAFRESGNVGFIIYIADSVGYLGSVAVLLWRNFGEAGMSWITFFSSVCYLGAGIIIAASLAALFYFIKKRNVLMPA